MKLHFYPLFLLAIASATLHAEFLVEITSASGDFSGRGKRYVYTSETAVIEVFRYLDNSITVTIDDLPGQTPNWWTLDIAAPNESEIKSGFYENVGRIPLQGRAQPGLLFSDSSGRYCSDLSGWFEVYSVTYDEAGGIEFLDMAFEQHCVGYSASHHGKISFDATRRPEE
ncbi:MAG: hypothetical protein MI756_02795 [Chromatiales bacterium]|nr:hypothetical protein [Chromatiales bacterium]